MAQPSLNTMHRTTVQCHFPNVTAASGDLTNLNISRMNRQKLIEILQIQTTTYAQFRMFSYIIRELQYIPNCRYHVHQGNIYVIKGIAEQYPTMVAHMDTVHEIVEELLAMEIRGNITGFNPITMKQSGIGGDDKVGIFITLECLQKHTAMKAVFFRDEETGCEGSCLADLSFFSDCSFVLQCDRSGSHEFIINGSGIPLSTPVFQSTLLPMLHQHGYHLASGLYTDVVALKRMGIHCCVANISCGYFNAHQPYEFVHLSSVNNCLRLVNGLFSHFGHQLFPHTYRARRCANYKYLWQLPPSAHA